MILDDLNLRAMLSQHLDSWTPFKIGFPLHAGMLRDESGEGRGLCQIYFVTFSILLYVHIHFKQCFVPIHQSEMSLAASNDLQGL